MSARHSTRGYATKSDHDLNPERDSFEDELVSRANRAEDLSFESRIAPATAC
jgi:hypothetical protein